MGGRVGEQVGGEKVDGRMMDESVDGWVGMGDLVDGGVDGGRLRVASMSLSVAELARV